MKTSVILLFCLFVASIAFGQIETSQFNVDVEEVRVTPPKFTGVEKAVAYFNAEHFSQIDRYLAKNFICPMEVAECRLEGTEIIQFTVNPNGSLSNFNVVNSVCKNVDEELIRILKTTNGMWMPGYNNGEPKAMEQEVSMMVGNIKQDEIINHFVEKAEKFFGMAGTSFLADNKPKKAMRQYNLAVRYLPNDKGLLMMRGFCNYELGHKEEARKDWQRIIALGGADFNLESNELAHLKGYNEMKTILAKK